MSAVTSPRERVVGRYVLCDEIAAGGMATVHLGRLMGPVGFARIVAIKRLHAHFAKDPEFVAMLLDEARLAARIQHPNVVSTIDVVVEKGEMLVVMDYVQGESLARLARAAFGAGETIPLGVVMSVMAGALYGLHAAHEATNDQGQPLGIVHRDVSPQNILVGVDGVPRVLDFGVAKAVGRAQTTREGTLKGKLAYMSPEQVRGEPVDRRSDVYAASVVLWELLCGQRLFLADNEGAVIHRIMSGAVVPPSHVRADLPPEVDALVMRGLAMRPGDRFATAWDMAEAAHRVAFATPGDVGAWVRRVCGDAIDERAARVAEIESDATRVQPGGPVAPEPETQAWRPREPALSASVVATVANAPPGPPTPWPSGSVPAPPASQPSRPSQPSSYAAPSFPTTDGASGVRDARRGVLPIVLAASLVAVLVGIGVGAVISRRGDGPAPTTGASAPTVTTAVTTAPSAAPSAIADTTATVTPSASSASASATPSASAPPKASTKPRSTVSPPRAKCNPPYTIDANGIRIPKPECL